MLPMRMKISPMEVKIITADFTVGTGLNARSVCWLLISYRKGVFFGLFLRRLFANTASDSCGSSPIESNYLERLHSAYAQVLAYVLSPARMRLLYSGLSLRWSCNRFPSGGETVAGVVVCVMGAWSILGSGSGGEGRGLPVQQVPIVYEYVSKARQ